MKTMESSRFSNRKTVPSDINNSMQLISFRVVRRVRAISLDLIKRRLDKGLYKRLDTFQEDVFSCLDRARRLSRTDSQIFEDSIELQSFFIKKRDEVCKDVLSSPALSYSAMHLSASVEAVRQTKLLQEEQEQEQENEMTVIDDDHSLAN